MELSPVGAGRGSVTHELVVAAHGGFEQMSYQFEDHDGSTRKCEGPG